MNINNVNANTKKLDNMEKNNFISKMNKYFDKKKIEYDNLFQSDNKNSRNKLNFFFGKDKNNDYIVEIRKDNNLILKGHYEVIGIYNIQNSVWYWGWNLGSFIDRKLTKFSKKVKKFSNYIKDNQNKFNPQQADELYYKTRNGNFYTSSNNLLQLIKLSLYLSKGEWFLSICKGNHISTNFIDYSQNNTVCGSANEDKNIDNTMARLEYIIIKDIIQK